MGSLKPTHITFKAPDGKRGHAELKPGTTWKAGKEAAKNFDAGSNAKPVRRK